MDRRPENENQKEAAPSRSTGKEPEPSVASRIAASASGLAKDLVGGSGANDASATLASGSGLASKSQGASSAAGPSTWSETLPARQSGSSSSNLQNGGLTQPREGFRENLNYSQQASGSDLDAFISGEGTDTSYQFNLGQGASNLTNGNINSGVPSWSQEFQQPAHSVSTNGSLDRYPLTSRLPLEQLENAMAETGLSREQLEDTMFRRQQEKIATGGMNGSWGHASNTNYDDGADVRNLLSSPDFSAEDHPSEITMEDPTPNTVNDLFGQNFTPEEKEAVDKIKSSLPPPPVHGQVSTENPFNLRPGFSFTTNPQLEKEIAELATTLGADQFMVNDPLRRQHLLAEWNDVLNGYTDEVWGDILPAVKAARTQLEDVKAGAGRLDSKAVARLRMILGHVVESTTGKKLQPSSTP
ncbi:uncharacterized protein K452DRAFT_69584 [Aplosporella prunicola CBS 121167]|uniref:Uncharacterized protein n=1 Tax=Aplosporella prunicola CBS 121167 TaxID=1176127 RepID=A0A6A6BRI5_9PEZI|nr:uncharacterized protein K452DRAFT_69584 [Aplosporella prunicola CBS 121167]KAF2146709.1 hypothetical protein K452DRAFT_69584 [Aplosporella prunicola CBS 121167]